MVSRYDVTIPEPNDKPPSHLLDARTGELAFTAASREWLIARLEARRDMSLREALAGCEFLFDRFFKHLNFSGASLDGERLAGMNFAGAVFEDTSFKRARIKAAGFRGARVDREALRKAEDWPDAVADQLRDAGLSGCPRPDRMRAPLFEPWAPWSEVHFMPELSLLPGGLDDSDLDKEEAEA